MAEERVELPTGLAISPEHIEASRKKGILELGDRLFYKCVPAALQQGPEVKTRGLMDVDCRLIDEALLSPKVRHNMAKSKGF